MEKQVIRVYFSGYVDRKIPEGMENINEIFDIKEQFTDSLAPQEIGLCMTEDDWLVYPPDLP
jgi:hypothetical protein